MRRTNMRKPQPAQGDRVGQACILPLAIVALSSFVSLALADANAPRRFGDMVGLQVKFTQGQPANEISMLTDLNVRWVRETIGWPAMEPSAGHYVEFPDDFKRRLLFYKEHDIGVVFVLATANTAAYPPTRLDPLRSIEPVAFGRYAVAVAQRLRAAGVRFALQVWKEPHNAREAFGGGAWNGAPPSPWIERYVRLVRQTVSQVKAVDPNVKVISNDDMFVLHYWFLEAGLPRQLDGFGFQPYSANVPEMAAVTHKTDWVKPFTIVDEDDSFASAVRRLRTRGAEKLGRSPELWVTEWGWPLEAPLNHAGGLVTEDLVAAFLPRAFIAAHAAGVDVLCWFSSRDAGDGPLGLLSNTGHRRKSYFAFKTLTDQLANYVLMDHTFGEENPTQGVQGFRFREGKHRKLVIWDIDGAKRRLRLSASSSAATAVDMLGEPITFETNEGGAKFVPLGKAPIYVTGLPDMAVRIEPIAAERAPVDGAAAR